MSRICRNCFYKSDTNWLEKGEVMYLCMYDLDEENLPQVSENNTCDYWEEDE